MQSTFCAQRLAMLQKEKWMQSMCSKPKAYRREREITRRLGISRNTGGAVPVGRGSAALQTA
ncbi:transposase domain protein [Burkholderia pseudomallei MSHR435]|nr:transposase domain protein [Burkholderia pseudomallei MSHR3016]KGW96436.1 transposase domain protein [Burkholderia pseudomallei MSHR449]KGX46580.1 transposase domain protein [Burkholderia pseudomallei MSHR2138]KGX78759.1 transposase domain protein [Burkholderia pseudomallei MSHR435]